MHPFEVKVDHDSVLQCMFEGDDGRMHCAQHVPYDMVRDIRVYLVHNNVLVELSVCMCIR